MQRRIIYFLTITVLFFGTNFLVAHIASQTKPFTMRQVLNAVASINDAQGSQKKALTDKILKDIRQRKVDFQLTKENEKLLRDEGASDEIIEAIRQNSPSLPTPLPTQKPTVLPTPTSVSTPKPTPISTPNVSDKEFKNSIGMEFVKIPSGEFMMGSSDAEIDEVFYECKKLFPDCVRNTFTNETPKHKVSIKDGFWMGKFEVTQGQWQEIMGDNPSNFKDCGANCPVEQVSWDDIQVFLKRLNAKDSQFEYSLPSEAQWEYAARGGTTTAFSVGDSLSSTQANFVGTYPYGVSPKGTYLMKTVKVGSYQPNAFGLYDLHGNVSEWVQDIYSENYQNTPVDGSANPSVGGSFQPMYRDCSWRRYAMDCRSTNRYFSASSWRSNETGFRLVARLKVSQNEKSQPTTSNTISGDNTSSTIKKNSIGMEFVRIPSGEFMMGSPTSETDIYAGAKPQHRVTISRDFYMGKTEVTQGQWKAVMGNNPSAFSSCGEDCPVEKVSWDDVQEFIRKLNAKNEGTYRLPTEAEWEYAARAGTTTPFGIGDGNNLSSSEANFNGAYPYGNAAKGKCVCKPVAVGSYQPNAWGLYDMHGNVWEWVQDWYGAYSSSAQTNPTGASTGSSIIIRGGSWLDSAASLRSAARSTHVPSFRNGNVGFRLVRQ